MSPFIGEINMLMAPRETAYTDSKAGGMKNAIFFLVYDRSEEFYSKH